MNAQRWANRLGWLQGGFYVTTGLWPVLHLRSFYVVTGPKTDGWLVQTVGALLAVFGAVLVIAVRRHRLTLEWKLLAAGFALVLVVVDIVFVGRGIISPIYLADAAAELVIAAGWIVVTRLDAKSAASRRSSLADPGGV